MVLIPEEGESVTLHATVVGHAGSPDAVAPERHWVAVELADGQMIQTNIGNLTLKRTRAEKATDAAAEVEAERVSEPEPAPEPQRKRVAG